MGLDRSSCCVSHKRSFEGSWMAAEKQPCRGPEEYALKPNMHEIGADEKDNGVPVLVGRQVQGKVTLWHPITTQI